MMCTVVRDPKDLQVELAGHGRHKLSCIGNIDDARDDPIARETQFPQREAPGQTFIFSGFDIRAPSLVHES